MRRGREGFYLTTPIYYASGEPHIGHAYTTILADGLARYRRQEGEAVLFLTGTDEHGQKIQEEAARRGLTPIALCDAMAARFREAWEELGISFDRFIRTTESEHVNVVQAFVQRLKDRGHVYDAEYEGWYSVHEERFFTEKELGPGHTDPIAGRPVERIREKNWFFRMSAFQEELVRHIEAHPDWIVPATRRNEVLGFLQKPLEDLSISRPRSRLPWGIPLPFDEEHVTYVWVDALINYVTASGVVHPGPTASASRGWDGEIPSWWPADLHLIGKDILTTHAVYWPTLLLGVGLPLPRKILAHGWWVVGETKMSKSLGNVVDPLALRERYGTDALRWYLLREMPTGQDASYTPERFLARYDELANVLGNLASRGLSMIARYRAGVVPGGGTGLAHELEATLGAFRASMAEYRVHDALAAAMELARTANGYVEEREPWVQAKDPERAGELDETLATLARVLTLLAALLEPVMPERMAQLAFRLGLDGVPSLDRALEVELAGRVVVKGDPLFPRVALPDPAAGTGGEDGTVG